MSNSQIQKKLEKQGWKFLVYMSGNGIQGEKGRRKVVGKTWTDLFRKILGN